MLSSLKMVTFRPSHVITTPTGSLISPVYLTWLIWKLLGIANLPGNFESLNTISSNHLSVQTFRLSYSLRLLSNTPYGNQGDLVTRHGTQWIDKRYSERREEMQRLLVLCPARSSGNNISITGDVIQLFKQVARIIHYCFTPLLFLPKWRLQVARTRDPNMSMATLSSTGEFVK